MPILAGTDAPIRANANGVSMLAELAHLVRAGLSPRAALAAATSAPAREFGLTDRGRIAPGLRADLLLVDGDPTTDITDLRAITAIWKNGHPVDRTPPE
ncbi:amidohydrolase family protein [Actinomadura namibiensis]|uniref:amidohydrolase family protein n=1 Tax=Actinomadura kijaniata TaxID=46161 RepID=UPI00361043D7